MYTYTAPGVYVEEISTLPPSVAEVATAVPAFIGYTNNTTKPQADGTVVVAQVATLREYETLFGKARPSDFTVTVVNPDPQQPNEFAITGIENKSSVSADLPTMPKHMLWYAIDLYFRNGGGRCYIVSIGQCKDQGWTGEDFSNGLDELKKYDEPTLVVMPEIVLLTSRKGVLGQALMHCSDLGDRFAIVDAYKGSDANHPFQGFRDDVVSDYLNYAAAYYPYLDTSLTHFYDESKVTVDGIPGAIPNQLSDDVKTAVARPIADMVKKWLWDEYDHQAEAAGNSATVSGATSDQKVIEDDGTIIAAIVNAIPSKDPRTPLKQKALVDAGITAGVTLSGHLQNCGSGKPIAIDANRLEARATTANEYNDAKEVVLPWILKDLSARNTALYNLIKQALAEQRVTLPPSPAIAGVYVRVDRERGVWKAPANVGLMSVIGPAVQVTNEEQGRLNVDPTTGKSINVIRSFPGKGVLVWGARTLDGNSNEWRYVPVRRLFLTIEESVKKASAFAVFEPNDATTWLKVKGMIEGYLYGLWEKGALQGSKPESAYYVRVGLGRTMIPQDILEGRLIVEVGIAAVRPAEFIVLKFMHKLAEA